MMTNLEGKKILITGGTTGIGRAIAMKLANYGVQLFIFGRYEEPLAETIAEVKKIDPNVKCEGIVADVATKEDIERVFQAVDEKLGGLDVLINNAAIAYQSIIEGNYDEWQYVVNTNLLGYMACAHEAIKRMRSKNGHIINIGSMSAETKQKDSSVYVATKSGIRGFSIALRKEVADLGIKVSLIEPGAVDTDMQDGTKEEKKEKIENMEMLPANDIAEATYYCLAQPMATAIVHLQIRPHAQLI